MALFYFIRIPASFHHFQHVLLLEARGMDETSTVGTTWNNRPLAP
jgi:hypothetical protein